MERIMTKLNFWKWKIKYFLHYWFGRKPWDQQMGDFVSGRKLPNKKKVIIDFSNQIAEILYSLHGEIIDQNGVFLIHLKPQPSCQDPLAQVGSWGWKTTVRIHVRSTWKKHQIKILKSSIKWRG